MLLKGQLGRVMILYLADGIRQLRPGLLDRGIGAELSRVHSAMMHRTKVDIPSSEVARNGFSLILCVVRWGGLTILGFPRLAAPIDMDMMVVMGDCEAAPKS